MVRKFLSKALLCQQDSGTTNMSDKLVLTYFDVRARAEWARLIMIYAGIDFEDRRIQPKDWPEIKPTMPSGQMPILEVNGVVLQQSVTIAHYVARRAGLCGSNDLEAAQAEMVAQILHENVNQFLTTSRAKDEAKTEEWETKTLPGVLKNLENILETNGGEWMVGKQMTWADILIGDYLCPENVTRWSKVLNVENQFPSLAKLVDKVNSIPKIKDWMEKRPKSTV